MAQAQPSDEDPLDQTGNLFGPTRECHMGGEIFFFLFIKGEMGCVWLNFLPCGTPSLDQTRFPCLEKQGSTSTTFLVSKSENWSSTYDFHMGNRSIDQQNTFEISITFTSTITTALLFMSCLLSYAPPNSQGIHHHTTPMSNDNKKYLNPTHATFFLIYTSSNGTAYNTCITGATSSNSLRHLPPLISFCWWRWLLAGSRRRSRHWEVTIIFSARKPRSFHVWALQCLQKGQPVCFSSYNNNTWLQDSFF